MESLFLFIHTLLPNQILVGLFNNKGLIDKVSHQSPNNSSKIILSSLDKLLKQNEIRFDDLTGIAVVNGPGAFTSIRLGLAVVNTISFILKIPAISLRLDEFKTIDDLIKISRKKIAKNKKLQIILPYYGKDPHITTSSKI